MQESKSDPWFPVEGHSGVKPVMDEETALSKMTPAQKEQLEKLKKAYEDKIANLRRNANLKLMAQEKAAAKRKKAEKVAKKQRKINRRKK
ncbi:MAG: hypothetical protein WC495_05860 [Patescibacteria group bacterium]|jgi:hypothetical protein